MKHKYQLISTAASRRHSYYHYKYLFILLCLLLSSVLLVLIVCDCHDEYVYSYIYICILPIAYCLMHIRIGLCPCLFAFLAPAMGRAHGSPHVQGPRGLPQRGSGGIGNSPQAKTRHYKTIYATIQHSFPRNNNKFNKWTKYGK